MNSKTSAIVLWAILSFPSLVRADIVINGYSAATNDRFTNSASFVAAGLNLSGIGQSDNGHWGTLISPNVIVSANHFTPSGNISFYANNDPSSVAVVRQVTNSMRIGTSDLWIARLNSPVDNGIATFQYATQQLNAGPGQDLGDGITLTSAGVYQDANSYMTGLSPALHAATQDQAMGRNLISGFADDVAFGGGHTDALIMWLDQPNAADFVTYEARFAGGDSGAPLFALSNGQLVLLGVNSFILQDQNKTVLASGSTYLGNYSSQIQQFVAISAVPEPSALIALASCVGTWAWRKRLRHKIQA